MPPTRPDISGGMPRLDTCAKIGAYRVPKLGLPSWRLLEAGRSIAKRAGRRSMRRPIWTHGRKRASARRKSRLQPRRERDLWGSDTPITGWSKSIATIRWKKSPACAASTRTRSGHGSRTVYTRSTRAARQVLAAFLKGRRTAGKRPSPPGHLYCFKCREPKPPAEGVVIVQVISDKVSNISAVCPTCGGTMVSAGQQSSPEGIRGGFGRRVTAGGATHRRDNQSLPKL
jgi:hypothetical protein